MTSEWDNTPWAGSLVPRIKAASGPGVAVWNNDIPLSSWRNTPQSRAAGHLAAYKVGWFNKAARKISEDISGLAVTVAPEDEAGGNTRFTAGNIRFAYRGVDDLRALPPRNPKPLALPGQSSQAPRLRCRWRYRCNSAPFSCGRCAMPIMSLPMMARPWASASIPARCKR